MIKGMKEFLQLHIQVTTVHEVCGGQGKASLVLFEGTAQGEYFNGVIESGGVDTQKEFGPTPGLSARYILSGKDNQGNDCKIFVENNGAFNAPYTSPKLITDSKALQWVETAELKGQIRGEENGLVITIYFEE